MADAICRYETSLSFTSPVSPLDENDDGTGAGEDKAMPAGYVVAIVIASIITVFVLSVLFIRFRARR